jgi:ATP-dependent Clp protease ATP-binding subunit ClpC
MFEKYTAASRRAVFLAWQEAIQSGHDQISPGHLLLGMLHEEDTRLEQLFQLRQHEAKIRERIYQSNPKREPLSSNQDLPLTGQCKQVLAYAADESELLRDKCIDSEHLLLGILRHPDLTATQCLNRLGLRIDQAREKVRANPVPERIHPERIPIMNNPSSESKWNTWGLVLLVFLAATVLFLVLRLR